MRDFLLRLNHPAEPVTYALSDEGLVPLHELHVPKNLVMLLVAGISGETNQTPQAVNEAIANSVLRTLASAEITYQSTVGTGTFLGHTRSIDRSRYGVKRLNDKGDTRSN